MDEMSLSKTELGALTYPHPFMKEYTLDDNELDEHCPLDNGQHTLQPSCGLGRLDVLPLEILNVILSKLDLQSLTDIRRINQRAMVLVNSFPHYQAVVDHAPAALRGMLSIGAARSNTCQDLYEKSCTAKCDICGDFGGYLYLITCKRVCFMCLSENTSYLPLLKYDVIRKFGLGSRELMKIPQIRSKPGCYTLSLKNCNNSLTLFDQHAARCAGITLHGTVSDMENFVSKAAEQRQSAFLQREVEYRLTGSAGKKPRLPRNHDISDAKTSNPHRFMAVVSAPNYLDQRARIAVPGFYCIGCLHENDPSHLHWRKRFTAETFVDHMKQWGEITSGYHSRSLKYVR